MRSVLTCAGFVARARLRSRVEERRMFSAFSRGKDDGESIEDIERRVFSSGGNGETDPLYKKFSRLGKVQGRPDLMSGVERESSHWSSEGDGLTTTSLSDGMDTRLKKAATYFEFDPEIIVRDDYQFRPDMSFRPGGTYDIEDLDLTKPAAWKPVQRPEFTVTTKEVLQKADFRNVRFLANFLTSAGTIIKRNKTKISAKAQRRVAREVKTARAFGLMPFTSMGSKQFVYGQSMDDRHHDYQYYDRAVF